VGALLALGVKKSVEPPIIQAVCDLIDGVSLPEVASCLMVRRLRARWGESVVGIRCHDDRWVSNR